MTMRKSNNEQGSREQDLESLIHDFPAGPGDDPEEYEVLLTLMEVGLVALTDQFRDGRRVWKEAPHRYSISEYPPGDRDHLLVYGVPFRLADEGVIRPTRELRNGQRVWQSLIRDPKKAN